MPVDDPPSLPTETNAELLDSKALESPSSTGRGWLTALSGGLVALLVFTLDRRLDGLGVLLGGLALLVASWGALDAAGAFDADPEESPATTTTLRALGKSVAVAVTMGLLTVGALRLAVRGSVPPWLSGALVTLSFLGLVPAVFAVGVALGPWSPHETGETGARRPLHRRHGFGLVVISLLLLLPTAGSHSLLDPWETHYGEVAREVLSRNDWISLWWAQDGWFFSKPVGNFWLQALAMLTLGVDYRPDHMLAADEAGRFPWPEWAVRTPIALLATLAAYLLYKGVAKAAGRRAGLLGALVLLTMPQWSLLSRQTMTDLPFVACLASAMALFLWGLHTSPEARLPVYEVHAWGVAWRLRATSLVGGMATLLILAQSIYLLSRNVTLLTQPGAIGYGFRWHLDQFLAGSPGNCTLPGNEPCRRYAPINAWLQPGLQAALWLGALAVGLRRVVHERRTQRVAFLGAYVFMALATLAKGPAALVLPLCCVGLTLVATGRCRDFLRLELGNGTLLFALIVLPWLVAMYVRHGVPFLDRFFLHDLWKRAVGHVHDTNEGDDVSARYYVWQLGYACFPWVGLLPAAFVRWSRRSGSMDRRDPTAVLLVLWFGVVFALFSAMQTKFHHYIFPALPPAAMLTGILLDRLLPRGKRPPEAFPLALSGALFVGAAFVALIGRDLVVHPAGELPGPARLLHLFTYVYRRPWPPALDFSRVLAGFTAIFALLTFFLAFAPLRKMAGFLLIAAALAFTGWELNVYLRKTSPHWGQRETIAAYYQHRSRPDDLLVAYQMNWKGENFYTGNHIATFVDGGDPFKSWLREQRKGGVRTVFVMTEHHRVNGLHTDLDTFARFESLTTREQNNKFVLLRVSLDTLR